MTDAASLTEQLQAAELAVTAAQSRYDEAQQAALDSDLCRYTSARATPEYFPELQPPHDAWLAAIEARAKVRRQARAEGMNV